MPEFFSEKSYCQLGLWSATPHLAGIAINSARHIYGETLQIAGIDFVDDVFGNPTYIAGQPGSEQRVNNQLGFIEERNIKRMNFALPLLSICFGIPFELFNFAQQTERHRPARCI